LKRFFQLSAADGGRRVVIIDSADEMNPSAANAILKVLEEPPAKTTLLLISHQPTGLLPTIRSRCRDLRCATLNGTDMALALTGAGLDVAGAEALTALAAGSVGTAIRLQHQDGLSLYADLVHLFGTLPRLDRTLALKLSDACAGRGAEVRFGLTLDLIDIFLARAARAGLMGEPGIQGAPGEARLLARLSPHDHAARRWATLQSDISARARAGRAVNLDPAALILDMLLAIEATARSAVAA
jgi:DNA polymerase III subunit delta'